MLIDISVSLFWLWNVKKNKWKQSWFVLAFRDDYARKKFNNQHMFIFSNTLQLTSFSKEPILPMFPRVYFFWTILLFPLSTLILMQLSTFSTPELCISFLHCHIDFINPTYYWIIPLFFPPDSLYWVVASSFIISETRLKIV